MSTGGVTSKKNPDVLLSVISFVIPLIGFILGIIFVAKSDQANKRTGKRCLIWALGGLIAGSIVTQTWIAKEEEEIEQEFQRDMKAIERMLDS